MDALDALDALLCYGYRVVRDGPTGVDTAFRLCGAKAFLTCAEDKKAVALLLQEIEETNGIKGFENYYVHKIIEIGRSQL